MRVTITTDGGFTGRGIGSQTADLDDDVCATLPFDRWRTSYSAPGADLVRYTLTMGDSSVSWVDGASIPQELEALIERVWKR